mmetsp:Transcript_5212/g.9563  ORF Transcript_5212/g.9563 Transcript_5212/m.9563 type:complete len:127 (+) Transcript_5212:3-383(+)
MFCGPIMDFSASWKERLPGGVVGPGCFAILFGTYIFMRIEEMEWHSAVYFLIVTGTTLGYGDLEPKTNHGRIATALFALLAVNVIGGMLEPAKWYLSKLCTAPPILKETDLEKVKPSKSKNKKKKS